MDNCVFCKIANKEIPSHIILENNGFLAFLDIFPEVEGMTIVIPKKHHPSYLPECKGVDFGKFIGVIMKVSKILDTRLNGVIRTKIVFEGLDIDHLHTKLYPMYKDKPNHGIVKKHKASERELKSIFNKLTQKGENDI